jgi:hypothetical protein
VLPDQAVTQVSPDRLAQPGTQALLVSESQDLLVPRDTQVQLAIAEPQDQPALQAILEPQVPLDRAVSQAQPDPLAILVLLVPRA